LVAAAVAMALLRAEVGFLTFLVAFGFRRAGAPSWWFGVVLAASMAASLTGSAVAPRLRRRVSEERILASALALVAVAGLGFARLDGRLWAAAVAAAVGLAAGAAKLAFDALVQRDAPDEERGRSFARFEAGFQLVWVFGALLPVVVATPLRQGYDVLGVAALAAAAAYVLAQSRLGTVDA
jgi:predicted MFS family arabinose efflux permease